MQHFIICQLATMTYEKFADGSTVESERIDEILILLGTVSFGWKADVNLCIIDKYAQSFRSLRVNSSAKIAPKKIE